MILLNLQHLQEKKKKVEKIKKNDVVITEGEQIAREFNQYFQSVFTLASTPTNLVYDFDITTVPEIPVSGVLTMLRKLNIRKSPGPDVIHNAFLRRFALQLAEFLTRIFQASLLSSQIPEVWKWARIKPVYKKGDKLKVSNYRPVSITCAYCKLLEHIVAGYIQNFLAENNVLYPCYTGV